MNFAAPRFEDSDQVLLQFAGHSFEPLTSGALFWPAERTLLVADLHLEKLSSFARSGQLLPPYDTGLTLKRLAADLRSTHATTLIALGDSFHRDEGAATLLDTDRLTLDGLMDGINWVWLSGNHDQAPHSLGGICLPHLDRRGLHLTHEPRRGRAGLIAGHLHPAAHIYINGSATRRPCFVSDGKLLILPAYGASTGSVNILSPAFAGLFDWSNIEVTMIGKSRVYPVSPKRLVGG